MFYSKLCQETGYHNIFDFASSVATSGGINERYYWKGREERSKSVENGRQEGQRGGERLRGRRKGRRADGYGARGNEGRKVSLDVSIDSSFTAGLAFTPLRIIPFSSHLPLTFP